MSAFQAHPTAVIDPGAVIGADTRIWHFAHICARARIGERCSFGQNTMVADDVIIGNNVKVQNNVAIYTGTEIEDDVFLGPSCVLTNVSNPRSQVVRRSLYEKTLIRRGASVGANATIVCGVTLGRYAFVAAGAVVVRDVPDYGLVIGVPGRLAGSMSRHGHLLKFDGAGLARCPESGFTYQATKNGVICLDLSEDDPLPPELATGTRSYEDFKGSPPPFLTGQS
ncbi:MAG: N-acetyltransferase [Verrucomicrobia bacterium]|nr:N-acetyltransferase [Verrucomicrobiota bacterium]